jgi:hypothetical protein
LPLCFAFGSCWTPVDEGWLAAVGQKVFEQEVTQAGSMRMHACGHLLRLKRGQLHTLLLLRCGPAGLLSAATPVACDSSSSGCFECRCSQV